MTGPAQSASGISDSVRPGPVGQLGLEECSPSTPNGEGGPIAGAAENCQEEPRPPAKVLEVSLDECSHQVFKNLPKVET